jgi:hypothetical protein
MDTTEKERIQEGLKFLERDFNQCFQQIRHYDSQMFDILKFMFTGYTALIGVALGLYKFGIEKNVDMALPASAALSVGLLLGLFMFALSIRNRVYFVQVTRYVNEQRGFFLCYKPLGFENATKMYTDYFQPPYFNWRSSQAWFMYIIAFLNSTLLGILLYIAFVSNRCKWNIVVIGSLVLFIVQLVIAIWYLISRENKSASKAVFGKE